MDRNGKAYASLRHSSNTTVLDRAKKSKFQDTHPGKAPNLEAKPPKLLANLNHRPPTRATELESRQCILSVHTMAVSNLRLAGSDVLGRCDQAHHVQDSEVLAHYAFLKHTTSHHMQCDPSQMNRTPRESTSITLGEFCNEVL